MDAFRFSPELFEYRNGVLETLQEAGYYWLSHFSSVDPLHDLYGLEDHHPLIGSCLDTGHLIRCAQPPFNKKLVPEDEVRVMKDRNFGMHLKDHDNDKKTDVVYGKGVLNVPEVLKALREVKFKGYISIEYEANPQDPSDDVKACVEVFAEAVKKLG